MPDPAPGYPAGSSPYAHHGASLAAAPPSVAARTATILCSAAAAIGATGLIGWFFEADRMTTFVQGRPPMMPNAAIALAALGAAGAFPPAATRDWRGSRALTLTLSLFALAIAVATLAEYAFGLDFDIDQLLVTVAAPPFPGRPSPITATALALLAWALLVRQRSRPILTSLVQGATLTAAFVAFVSLVGHVYGAGRIYQFSNAAVVGVALPMSIALLLLSAGILLRDADTSLVRLLTTPRPAGALARRLAAMALIGIPALGFATYRAMVLAGLADVQLTLALLTVISVPVVVAFIMLSASELDRAYLALEQSRERARTLVDEGVDGIFIADVDGRYLDVNAAGCRMLGMSRQDIIGKTIVDFIPAEDVPVLASVRVGLLAGEAHTAEWRLRRADGSLLDVEVSAKILLDGRWQGIARDITERKRAEEAARRMQARLDGIISLAADAIISVDDRHRIVMFNRGAERIFGWSRDEVLGQPLDVLLPSAAREVHRLHIAAFEGEAVSGRMMSERALVAGVRRNGEMFPAEAAISKLEEDGRALFTVILRDTTTTRQLQEDLQRSVRRFRLLAEAGEALSAHLAAGDFVVAAVERVTALAVENIAGCCAIELRAPAPLVRARGSDGAAIADLQPFLLSRPEAQRASLIEDVGEDWWQALECDERLSTAIARPTSAILAPIWSGEQRVGALMLVSGPSRRYDHVDLQVAIDLAARLGLAIENRRLYEAERTAIRAREEVLGIVAHDLRSPLGAVQHGADILSTMVPEDRRETTHRVVDAIQRSIRRARRLVDDLLDVARIDAGKLTMVPTVASADALVRAVVELYAPIAAQVSVRLDTEVAPGLPPVFVDEDRIHQVLSNLVDNALKFSAAGGCVRVVVARDGGRVRFSVVDTGAGIPPEHLAHLFERFWQGATHGRGTGLGLAIARGIVEAHGGRLSAESVVGNGSTFSFTVPT